jgi:SNF2 family DNA or RNA helicase
MVCHSVEVQQCASPFLIVCPASVLSNWANELQHWAPDLSVVQYRGSADAREEIYRKQVRLNTRQFCLVCDIQPS